jgi:hypothetical protein
MAEKSLGAVRREVVHGLSGVGRKMIWEVTYNNLLGLIIEKKVNSKAVSHIAADALLKMHIEQSFLAPPFNFVLLPPLQ